MARKIEVAIVGDSRSLERAFGRAKVSSRGFVGSIESAGGALAGIGRKIAVVGAALTAGGIGAAKFGATFQESMQKIVGLSGVAQDQVDKLSQQVLALAPTVGKSPQELAEALFFITSSGIEASKSIDVLTNSAKASVAGLGDTVVVADAVTSAINAYGAANITAKHATDVLVAAVREGKGEADAIAGSIGNVAALAAQLGVKFNEVGAALAAETRIGIDAETASVQLQQVFSNLIKVAPQAEKAFKSVGLSSAGLRKELSDQGLIATLTTIKQAFGDNLPALARAFPNIRALRGVLALVGKDAAETQQVFAHLTDTSTSLKTAFDAVSTDTAQQFRKLRASVAVAGIAIGAVFAPLAGAVSDALAKTADRFAAFIADFSKARTLHAKLAVVWDGVQDATKSAEDALKKAADAVDWKKVWADASGIADGLQAQLESIDWSGVGKSIGDGIAKGVSQAAGVAKALANRIEDAFRAIDFNALGRAAGPGLAAAILSAFATLTDPAFWIKNWDLTLAVAATFFGEGLGKIAGKLAAPVVRIFGDVFLKALVALERVAPRFAEALFEAAVHDAAAFGRGFEKIGEIVERIFNRIAKKVGKPITFIVKVLGLQAAIDAVARAFQHIAGVIKHALDGAFNFLKIKSLKAALDIIEPFSHLPKKLGGGPFQQMKKELQQKLKEMQADGLSGGAAVSAAISTGVSAGAGIPAAIAAVQNQVRGIVAAATQAAGIGSRNTSGAGAAATKAPTAATPPATTTSSPTATARTGTTAGQQNTFFDNAISRILLRGGLGTIQQQIAALEKADRLIAQRIKATKDVTRRLNLEDELLGNEAQIKSLKVQAATDALQKRQDARAKAMAALTAKQFRQLGLSATGDAITPGVSGLKKRLSQLTANVKASTLNTPKLQAELARFRKVLSEGLVPKDVRAKIKDMMDAIADELKGHGAAIDKFAKTNQSALLKGLGLDPAQIKALKARLSQVGVDGRVPAPVPQTATGGSSSGAGGMTFVQHTTIKLDNDVLGRAVTRHQQTTKSRNPDQRRGLFPGGV